jgi:hypothetical protein
MKTLIHSLSNTYKAIRLLSNPAVSELLEKELSLKIAKTPIKSSFPTLSTKNTYFHKHYMVQITN